MKKTLLLAVLLTMGASASFAQMDYSLTEFELTLGREKSTLTNKYEGNFLFGEEKFIEIYRKDGMIYRISVRADKSGKRIKFVRRGELITPDGKTMKGKTEKSVHLIKTSASGTIDGYHNDYFLYDKDQLKSFKITFKYVFNYL